MCLFNFKDVFLSVMTHDMPASFLTLVASFKSQFLHALNFEIIILANHIQSILLDYFYELSRKLSQDRKFPARFWSHSASDEAEEGENHSNSGVNGYDHKKLVASTLLVHSASMHHHHDMNVMKY